MKRSIEEKFAKQDERVRRNKEKQAQGMIPVPYRRGVGYTHVYAPAGSIPLDSEPEGRKPHVLHADIEKKHCACCDEWKPLDAFYANNHPTKWDTHDTYCIECAKIAKKKSALKHS